MLAENSDAPGLNNFLFSFSAFILGLPKTSWWFLPTKNGLEALQAEKINAVKMRNVKFFISAN
jgi:hypothetical protein